MDDSLTLPKARHEAGLEGGRALETESSAEPHIMKPFFAGPLARPFANDFCRLMLPVVY
jgi:hypothetical protein